MNLLKPISALVFACVVAACSMPQPMPMPPTSPPAPSGSPSPSTPLPPSPSDAGSMPPSDSGEQGEAGMPTGGEQLPMPGADESAPAGAEVPPGGAPPGGAGDAGDLDAQLDEALEDFDESMSGDSAASGGGEIDILNPMGSGSAGIESDEPIYEEPGMEADGTPAENDEIAERAAEGAPGGEAEGSEDSGGAEGLPGEGGAPAPESAEGQNSGSGASAGEEGDANIIPIPDDVGDGRDDDIVMRQIREAAMKEKNPELREKLWDEYRRIRDQR